MEGGVDISTLIATIAFIALIVSGWVYIRSALVKQRESELERLVDTRGARIADLENRVEDMRREIAALRGQLEALTALKASEIAAEVARVLGGGE